jgi:DNA-binding PadR family transcriptional regulator
MFLSSDAQYQMMEDLKEKGEIKYFTKFHTGKAYRTAHKLALVGYVKVKHYSDPSGKYYIVVSLTEKGKTW